MDAAKIVELAAKSGIAAADAEALVSFALGYADGARNADSTEPVHLFGAAVSANVTPIWAFLVATGIPFEYHEVDLMGGAHLAEEFLSMNPYHTVPTIKHGDFCLHESSAILRYLTRAFPTATAKYYGNGDIRKQALIDCALDERLGNLYGKIAPIMYPLMGFAPKPDEATLQASIEKALEPLNKFANHFLKDGEFVGGDHPSIAEFSILAGVLTLQLSPFFDQFPESIHKWAAALEKAVPAFATVFDGTTNGRGFGVKQFMAMRVATWEATPVGAINGAPEEKSEE